MSRLRTVLLLLGVCAAFYLLPLAFHGLWVPDETRYAQASQEMLLSGNWAAPHFLGLRYFEKPPAGYWMMAVGQAVFGQNLFGARVASAFSLGLSVLLTYLIAQRLWRDPQRSLACSVLYMSFALIVGMSGYNNVDPPFALWVNLSFVALWFAIDAGSPRQRTLAWMGVGIACAMALLTKGFLALVLPVLVAVPYMAWQRRFTELLRQGLLAVLVAVLVCLPWSLLVHGREADFWNFFFWHEHIQRFAGADAQHAEPIWFYLPLLVLSSLPWAALLPLTLEYHWNQRREARTVFLALWLILPLAFLSIAKGKLPTYILPCMMPLALLMGPALNSALQGGRFKTLRVNSVLNLLLGVVGIAALLVAQHRRDLYQGEPWHVALIGIALAGWVGAHLLSSFKPRRYWMAPAFAMMLLMGLLPAALPQAVVNRKTPDTFIAAHTEELRQLHRLVSNDLGAAAALAWHTARPEIFLYNTEGEANYGLDYPDAQHRRIRFEDIAAWLAEARRSGSVGVLMRVRNDNDVELSRLPGDFVRRYQQGGLVVLVYEQSPP
jgi:4-amino-4-deoxy-L-arabinose transferase